VAAKRIKRTGRIQNAQKLRVSLLSRISATPMDTLKKKAAVDKEPIYSNLDQNILAEISVEADSRVETNAQKDTITIINVK
jgi:hypothetical protein